MGPVGEVVATDTLPFDMADASYLSGREAMEACAPVEERYVI